MNQALGAAGEAEHLRSINLALYGRRFPHKLSIRAVVFTLRLVYNVAASIIGRNRMRYYDKCRGLIEE